MELWQLKQMQCLPLEIKVEKTKLRIKEFYEHFEGGVYISFSGGKDSTVLLDIARNMYKDIDAVYSDTGLEFPEIRDFVKEINNVTWIKPKKNFKQVINEYGYPVISKEVSDAIYGARKGQQYRIDRLNGTLKDKSGNKSQFCCEKYNYLLDAPFKISNHCCYWLKKSPFMNYEKETGKKPIIGCMAEESRLRKQKYLKDGCNAFDSKRPKSNPLSFWNERDIWDYINKYNVKYSKLYDMGYERSGCVFCMFGIMTDKNRFERLKKTHLKLYNYCMKDLEHGGLGMEKVLDFLNINNLSELEKNQIDIFEFIEMG